MAKAIEQLPSGLVIGHALLGRHGQGRGIIAQQVHDGDTVTIEADGNFGVRFLGIDAPEVSIPLGDVAAVREPHRPEVGRGAHRPARRRSGPGVRPAVGGGPGRAPGRARRCWRGGQPCPAGCGRDDRAGGHGPRGPDGIGQDEGRLPVLPGVRRGGDGPLRSAAGLSASRPARHPAAQRFGSYNERLLAAGWVSPYFIWPNINPFRRAGSVTAAVPPPGGAAELAERDGSLRAAPRAIAQARRQELGLYAAPLGLLPFELRFLARRQPPDRWLVDLSTDAAVLVPPQAYPDVPLPEDRLFVPTEYVPLWEQHGRQRG